MSSGITDFDTMFSTGKVPWHGLGTRLPALATAEEALAASGLDWTVIKVPIVASMNGHSQPIPGFAATVRESDKLPLGIAKDGYQVFQNEMLFQFGRALVDTDQAVFETAGSLFAGKLVWTLLKVPTDIILPRDGGTILPYIMVLSSHDGTKALTVRPTPVRVECANTVSLAVSGNKSALTVKHTAMADPMVRIVEAQDALGFTFKWYESFEKTAETLIKKRMSAAKLQEFVDELFPNRKGDDEETATRTQNRRDAVLALAKNAENLEAVRGTGWAAYNAAAEYADHGIKYRETDGTNREDNRAASILNGSAVGIKERAQAILLS